MKIKGAIFDMDGTLVDSLHFWGIFWNTLGKTFLNDQNFLPPEELNKKVRTMVFSKSAILVNEYYHFFKTNQEFSNYTNDFVISFYKSVKPKNGAIKLLQVLKNKGIQIYLASATDKNLLIHAIEACKLTKFFDGIFSCGDIGVGKDKPDIYYKVSDAMNLQPNEICVFEDAHVAIETAKKAGFNTVGVFDKHNFCQERVINSSDYYIDELHDLSDVINIIE